MSILSGFFKTKRYRKTTDGYKLESNWTSGNTVELDDGNTVQNNLGAIKGITTSTSVTEEGYAADATTVAALNNNLTNINNSLTSHNHDSRYYTESEINTKLNAKQDNSSALKITTNYFRVSSTANTDANANMANITRIASSRIKAVIPCFVASSAFSLTELVLISSPNNTYEFAVKNPTNMNTDVYIRVYTIYV